ncbi:uncharacterized protein LOC135475144 [Liolophura sinensis]|uniref:uncharacterized protein LOC135475144 n=1 Tax=Liolophura sinensis TaxID=3198878 RepID=UPI00315808A3
MESLKFLTVLQVSDSAFPTGGFSHSGGLEVALKYNYVTTSEKLEQFLVCSLENAGSFSLPFLTAAFKNCFDVVKVRSLDHLIDVSTTNHVAKRASVRQGRSLLEMCHRTLDRNNLSSLWEGLSHCHQPVVLGSVCGVIGLPLQATQTMFMFGILRTVVASAVRLDIIGPVQAQLIQHKIQALIPAIIARNEDKEPDAAALAFPHVDVVQNCQDTLYSKLFYS